MRMNLLIEINAVILQKIDEMLIFRKLVGN